MLAFSRPLLLLFFTLLVALGTLGAGLAQAQAPHVAVINVDGIITPVQQRFIDRAIREAHKDQAELLIIRLDTPGGLLDSTRKIVEDLLEAPLPVAVYVSPSGARAGSAGTFITAAAHFAVMAPGTNIGAATPVSGTGQQLDETMASKVTNDAAALIRSIAQVRGRNQDKLEETVRQAASFSATEAVELNVVDFIATDLEDLLAQLDGQTVEISGELHTLDTRDLRQRNMGRNPLEHFLSFISDPNISFILLTVGGLGIVIELFNPGLIVPGVVGIISLLLAFMALGNLPVNWAGLAFILLAIGLAVLEIQAVGFGILGIGAIISFLLGGLILFSQFGDVSPTMPRIGVNRWLLVGMGGTLGLMLLYVLRSIHQSRKASLETVPPSIVGTVGRVTTPLAPRGVVHLGNENWTAISEDGNLIDVGEPVKVTKVDGLTLTVSRHHDTDVREQPSRR